MLNAAGECFLLPAEVVYNYLKALKLVKMTLPGCSFNEVLGQRWHDLPYVDIGPLRYYDVSYIDADADEKSERQRELAEYHSWSLMEVAVHTLADLTPVPRCNRSSTAVSAAV